jgi:signal transduction histidine kinase
MVRFIADCYTNQTIRIFVMFFFAIYIVDFIISLLRLVFEQLRMGQSPFAMDFPGEILELFNRTTQPFFSSGVAGILVIMLFISLVSYLLTRALLAPVVAASEKQRLFAANASHELRTPLSIMKTLAEVAEMRSANLSKEEVKKFTTDIVSEVDRMSRIIEFFVRFSAIESGKANFQMSPVRLDVVADNVIRTIAHKAKEFGVTLVTDENMTGVVYGNMTALEEMLDNLVRNAIKFSPNGGVVRISSKANGHNDVHLIVEDHGRGISSEDLPHIFEPFYQSSENKSGKGSGLGLTLVKQIAKMHNAKVEIKTKVGSGTTFTVIFPK